MQLVKGKRYFVTVKSSPYFYPGTYLLYFRKEFYGKDGDDGHFIQFSVDLSLSSRYYNFFPDFFDLIEIDECSVSQKSCSTSLIRTVSTEE